MTGTAAEIGLFFVALRQDRMPHRKSQRGVAE
jgi:hypothetical protein